MIFEVIKSGWQKLKTAVHRVREALLKPLYSLLGRELDEETLAEIEQLLYEADFGLVLSQELVECLRIDTRRAGQKTPDERLAVLKSAIYERCHLDHLSQALVELQSGQQGLQVLFIAGINGSGKTTSIAKLAYRFKSLGKSVLLAAADTFRAAAVDQLQEWSMRAGVDLVRGSQGADPSSVVYDALAAAKARKCDLVLIDTAGRLHNKSALMQELEKMTKIAKKVAPEAKQDFLLVLDAVTGQNAIEQAKAFFQVAPVKGVILTKIDGAAKGGIALAIQQQCKIPIAYLGTGEGIEDLEPFDLKEFIDTIFEE